MVHHFKAAPFQHNHMPPPDQDQDFMGNEDQIPNSKPFNEPVINH